MFLISLPRETVHSPLAVFEHLYSDTWPEKKILLCYFSYVEIICVNKQMYAVLLRCLFCHQYFNWESNYDWEELHETYASCPSERNTTMQQLFLHIITFVHLFVILLRTDICFETSLFCMNVWYTCLQISLSYYDFFSYFFYRSLLSKVHHFRISWPQNTSIVFMKGALSRCFVNTLYKESVCFGPCRRSTKHSLF